MYKPKHYKIQELVCPHVYEKHGSKAWNFFHREFLQDLDRLRDLLGCPVIINDWHTGGSYSQSGLRCPLCATNEDFSMSAHNLGGAVDIRTGVYFSKQISEKIISNYRLFKSFKRIENILHTPSWCHIDTRGHHEGIVFFNP